MRPLRTARGNQTAPRIAWASLVFVSGSQIIAHLLFLEVAFQAIAEPAEQPSIETHATVPRAPKNASTGASQIWVSLEGVITALDLDFNLFQTSSMTLALADGAQVTLTMTRHATTVTQQDQVLSLEQLAAGDRVLVRYRRKDRTPRARTIEILQRVKTQDAPMHYAPPPKDQPVLTHHGGHKKN